MSIGNPISLTSNVASKTISLIATASQTAFTVTGGYRINAISVFRNGVRLVDGRDYEARDGASLTLLSAASEGDVVEIEVFDTFRVAEAIQPNVSNQTINGNLNVTGILTGSTINVTDLNLRNITGVAATFSGVVTYEDVTNVDSVGIITAQSDISIADKIIHTGDTNTAIRFPLADTFTVETAGSEAIRIDPNGHFMLGQTSPYGVIGAGSTVATFTNSGNHRNNFAISNQNSGSNAGSALVLASYGQDWIFEATSIAKGQKALKIVSGSDERLCITSSGYVGIGTTNPQSVIDIAKSSINPGILITRTDAATAGGVSLNAGNTVNYINSSKGFSINTLDTLAISVDTGQNVKIIGIATATQLYEGTNRVATGGKAIAMALIFG